MKICRRRRICPYASFDRRRGARYLGISRCTLYRLIEFGEIETVKSRGTTLIEKESLDDFRASGKLT
jgi:excisionase family DNA binding protein